MDTTPLGKLVAEIMEVIEEGHGPDAKLTDAMVIVEVETEDGEVCRVRSLGKRYTSDLGLVERARLMLHSVPDETQRDDD